MGFMQKPLWALKGRKGWVVFLEEKPEHSLVRKFKGKPYDLDDSIPSRSRGA